ncbi:hypothetical protein QE152_g6014 [Popillia japonica]|uniref:Uncharacterized protein n=1 Tax=Popillia japonica TaxID=7064 RepID=A0AAW1MJJ1_POPJA
MYQVFFFELFNNKKSDDEEAKPNATNRNQSHQSSNINNSHPDLRILDFIKKIYNSDPIYEKKVANKTRSRSREDGDKTNNHGKRFRSKTGPEEKNNDGDEPRCSNSVPAEQGARHRQHRHHHHHHHHHHRHQETNKCKKTETKSYYTSVESYSTTNANYYVNSSTSSTVSSKYTRSKNSDSTMYSFLLIPRNELNACASNNELSTSYAPSVNSLPFEDEPRDDRARPNVETNVELNPKEHCDDTDDCDLLSPRNYAKTLNAIYELDENGKMRTKSQDGNSSGGKLSEPVKVANSPSSSESRFDLPCNTRNLSTIYEIDEKLKESDLSVNQKLSSKLFNQNRHHQDMNRQSSVAVHVTSSERSRIPVSIHSLSSCTSGSKEKLAAKTSRQLKVANASSKSSLGTTRSQYSVNNPLCDKRASSLVSHNSSKTSAYSQCSRISKLHSSSIDSVEAYTLTKNLVAKVHPKVAVKQSNVSATSNKSIKLQPALDGTDNLELPITFDIVRPSKKNSSCTMKIETNVMSLNIDSTTCSVASGIRDNRKRFRCYRSENMCVWPQLQKKFETYLLRRTHRAR